MEAAPVFAAPLADVEELEVGGLVVAAAAVGVVGVGVALAEALAASPLVIVENVVHDDDGGAGCAAGVAVWPCWNVDVPYTPIGSPESPTHFSKIPGA